MSTALGNIPGFPVQTALGAVPGVAVLDANGTQVVPGNARNSGGAAVYSFVSTNAVWHGVIAASPAQVYGLQFFNNSGSIAYGRLYNQTSDPANTDSPAYRFLVPANTSGAGFVVALPDGAAGLFSIGLGIRVTSGIADNDTGALTANTILGNVFYKS